MIARGSSGLKARVDRCHRGRCAAIRVFSVLVFGLGFPRVWFQFGLKVVGPSEIWVIWVSV